jgi:putative oxidoreductase
MRFTTPQAGIIMLHVVAALFAVLLLVGSWTPIVGVLMALTELGLAFSHGPDPAKHLLLGTLGAVLAMLGPGAWSIDARRFGRKRLQFPQRSIRS